MVTLPFHWMNLATSFIASSYVQNFRRNCLVVRTALQIWRMFNKERKIVLRFISFNK